MFGINKYGDCLVLGMYVLVFEKDYIELFVMLFFDGFEFCCWFFWRVGIVEFIVMFFFFYIII